MECQRLPNTRDAKSANKPLHSCGFVIFQCRNCADNIEVAQGCVFEGGFTSAGEPCISTECYS